jgi:preprotein translocase subunit SecD
MTRSLGVFACICLVCYSYAVAQTPARSHSLIEFRPARMTPAPGYPLIKSVGDTNYYVADTAIVLDDDIANARADTSALNGLVIEIHLKPPAASRLHEFTQRHLKERLAVFLNGELSGTPPLIVGPLSTGSLTLVGQPAGHAQQFAAAIAARWHSGP